MRIYAFHSFASVSHSPANLSSLTLVDAIAEARMPRKTMASGEPWLHDEVARQMAKRLSLIRHPVKQWVDWSPSRGGWAGLPNVSAQWSDAKALLFEADPWLLRRSQKALQPPWWKRWIGLGRTPQTMQTTGVNQAVDMVWCNMQLHMASDPLQGMRQWSQALRPDGFVMFSCLGPDSLQEIRALYQAQGWPPPHHPWVDMHDWGDLLLKAGFEQPVMDMTHLTLTYPDAKALLKELRTLGRNLHPDRFKGLRGRAWRRDLCNQLHKRLASDHHNGRLALTFEIVFGHAFKASARSSAPRVATLDLSEVRSMLKKKEKGQGG